MPYATTKDNVKLYYEEAGSGSPILFCHDYSFCCFVRGSSMRDRPDPFTEETFEGEKE